MALNSQQRQIVARIIQIGKKRGAGPKQIKAALETGLVESNFTNSPNMTDHDSQGWRQERASLYKDPTNLDASINRFYDETGAVAKKYGRAGDLAAAVQRPAAQYRGRYQQRSTEADRLLSQFGSGVLHGEPTDASAGLHSTAGTPGVDRSAERAALLQQYVLSKGKSDPHESLMALATGLNAAEDTPVSKAPAAVKNGPGDDGSLAARLAARANQIDAKKLPYLWGGGHGGKVDPKHATPLDCSGAVSAVLGINPRVSGEFEKWGKPGDGGNKGVTIYANGHHVLMKIGGHFFGTSQTNPGGGAGWIPRKAISPQYLQGFTARHA